MSKYLGKIFYDVMRNEASIIVGTNQSKNYKDNLNIVWGSEQFLDDVSDGKYNVHYRRLDDIKLLNILYGGELC